MTKGIHRPNGQRCGKDRPDNDAESVTVRRLRLQYEVASLLARAKSAQEGLAKALAKIADSEKWDLGIAWLLKGSRWDYECDWQRPGLDAAIFLRASKKAAPQGLPLVHDVTQAHVFTRFDDLSLQPSSGRIAAATRAGLSAAVSIPLTCDDTPYGVVELFRVGAECGPDSSELFKLLGCDIGQFLQARRIEAGLLYTHARFAEAQRMARLAHWEFSPQSGRLKASAGMADLLNLAVEQLPVTEDQYFALVPQEDHPILRRAMQVAMQPGAKPQHFEHRLRGASGQEKIVTVRTETQFDANGVPVRVSGTLQDITEQRQAAARILASERRWEAAFRNSPVPSLITDVNTGRCLAANDEMLRLLALPCDQVIGRSTLELKFWSDPRQRDDMVRMLKEHGRLRQYEFSTNLNGEQRFVLGNMEEVELNGRACLLSQLVDITPRKRLEETLRLTAAAVEHAGEGLILLSAKGEIISINPAFTRITGYQKQHACGMALDELLHRPTNRHDDLFFRRIAGNLAVQGHWEGQAWARRHNGSDFPAFLTLNAIRDHDARITNYVAVFSDVSKQREYEARLEQLALCDGLTGLANRTLLTKRADQALVQAKRHGRHLAVLFADLNRFKEVNDLYGHAVGDELLKLVARRLVNCVRAGDTIARLGGDEFVVLLPEVKDAGHVLFVVEKIIRSLDQPFFVGTLPLSIGATVGIARYPEDGLDMPALLRHADEDLYRRKPVALR